MIILQEETKNNKANFWSKVDSCCEMIDFDHFYLPDKTWNT